MIFHFLGAKTIYRKDAIAGGSSLKPPVVVPLVLAVIFKNRRHKGFFPISKKFKENEENIKKCKPFAWSLFICTIC